MVSASWKSRRACIHSASSASTHCAGMGENGIFDIVHFIFHAVPILHVCSDDISLCCPHKSRFCVLCQLACQQMCSCESSKILNHADCQCRAATSLLAQRRRARRRRAAGGPAANSREKSVICHTAALTIRMMWCFGAFERTRECAFASTGAPLEAGLTFEWSTPGAWHAPLFSAMSA